jgi:hypothetical protein
MKFGARQHVRLITGRDMSVGGWRQWQSQDGWIRAPDGKPG